MKPISVVYFDSLLNVIFSRQFEEISKERLLFLFNSFKYKVRSDEKGKDNNVIFDEDFVFYYRRCEKYVCLAIFKDDTNIFVCRQIFNRIVIFTDHIINNKNKKGIINSQKLKNEIELFKFDIILGLDDIINDDFDNFSIEKIIKKSEMKSNNETIYNEEINKKIQIQQTNLNKVENTQNSKIEGQSNNMYLIILKEG